MIEIQSSRVLSKLFQSSRVFLVEGIEWNWSSIDQQHQSLGDRSTCFFHVLDMLGILKIVVELKESNMIEIRCLNYQLCHLSPHVVTYLTPKNADNKNIHHLVAFLPWPRINLWRVRLFLYKPHTIVVDNGNIWGWIPFNETFQVILVRGDVCKLKISLRAWQGRNPRKFLVTKRWGDVHDYLFVSSVFWLVTVTWTFLWGFRAMMVHHFGMGGSGMQLWTS